MIPLNEVVRRMIRLRQEGQQMTLLAVCPNSDAVLEAAVKVATANDMPMLFAATLNQVDRDGGYTGWTPARFVARLQELAALHHCTVPLYPCLDHGGPWLKDAHALAHLSFEQAMTEVKESITTCLEAGYALLHIDATVDRSLPPSQPPPVSSIVGRTTDLMLHAEQQRRRLGLPPVAYEVGTEEVHGGLADLTTFESFLEGLRRSLSQVGLEAAWPCFIVGKVGTDLHTTTFDADMANRLSQRVIPLGSLIKGHYTDWVANPAAYPISGMGAANVGPEFTAAELEALKDLCRRERQHYGSALSGFEAALERAVIQSGRWRKWLLPEETGFEFHQLSPSRKEWLIATGSRYVWTDADVLRARQVLYKNLSHERPAPHEFVIGRIAATMQRYVDAFNLRNSAARLRLQENWPGK